MRPLPAIILVLLLTASPALAQTNVNVNSLLQRATIFPSPKQQTVIVGSTFEVGFFLNSLTKSANAVELNISFPPDKLQIVKPAGDKSIISIWAEAPRYSNSAGTAHFTGVIPGGIVTDSGLITTITFKALSPGQAPVSISASSKVLANDGLGTEVVLGTERGVYTITAAPPEGVKVFSDTHPVEFDWYNNPNPIFLWEKSLGLTDFSYELDNKPFTVPDNNPETEDSLASFENIENGIWYFHLKARKGSLWGETTHFTVRIDTAPPAEFSPRLEVLAASVITRALVTFFTTDYLSGLDHYEVGVIEKSRYPAESPAFVQAESPYQLSNFEAGDLVVVVRAFDRAGNVRDAILETYIDPFVISFLKNNGVLLIAFLLFILLILSIAYIFTSRKRNDWTPENETPTIRKRVNSIPQPIPENYPAPTPSQNFYRPPVSVPPPPFIYPAQPKVTPPPQPDLPHEEEDAEAPFYPIPTTMKSAGILSWEQRNNGDASSVIPSIKDLPKP